MKINGFEKLRDIRTFSLVKCEGEHTTLTFTARTAANIALPFLSREGTPITISRDDGSTLFYGLIREVSVSESHHGAIVAVEAKSFSILADEEFHTRIFQNPNQTLGDILKKISWDKAKCELDLDEVADKKPSGLIVAEEATNAVVQNDETDFSFLLRLAHLVGYRLFIADTISGRTTLELAKTRSRKKISAKEIITLTRQQRKSKFNLKLRAKPTAELDVGTEAQIEGLTGSFVVMKKSVIKQRETFIFTYELESADDVPNQSASDGQGGRERIFSAKITSVDDPKKFGRVQVAFDGEDMAKNSAERLWIPWRTSYGGKGGQCGIVFLPDKNDRAEILLAGNSLVASNNFRTGRLLNECSKPAEKYIGNNFKQRIFWREKSLELFSADNMIFMDEKKIELVTGKGKTRIRLEEDKIFMQTPDNLVELSSAGIKIKTDKDFAAQSGKNFTAKSGGSLKIESGKDFEMNAQSSAKIESSSTLKLKGKDFEMNAQGSGKIESSSTLKLKGSTVEIS